MRGNIKGTIWPKDYAKAFDIINHFDKAWRSLCGSNPEVRARCHEKADAVARYFNLERVDGYVGQNEHSFIYWGDYWILDVSADHVGACANGLLLDRNSAIGCDYREFNLDKRCLPMKRAVNKILKALKDTEND